ncbi:hypothetical protein KI387_000268, partial [Taxus chinensis]
ENLAPSPFGKKKKNSKANSGPQARKGEEKINGLRPTTNQDVPRVKAEQRGTE